MARVSLVGTWLSRQAIGTMAAPPTLIMLAVRAHATVLARPILVIDLGPDINPRLVEIGGRVGPGLDKPDVKRLSRKETT